MISGRSIIRQNGSSHPKGDLVAKLRKCGFAFSYRHHSHPSNCAQALHTTALCQSNQISDRWIKTTARGVKNFQTFEVLFRREVILSDREIEGRGRRPHRNIQRGQISEVTRNPDPDDTVNFVEKNETTRCKSASLELILMLCASTAIWRRALCGLGDLRGNAPLCSAP